MLLRIKHLLIDLRCWLLGHNYKTVARYGHTIRKVHCPRCKETWFMEDSHKAFFRWDGECDEIVEGMPCRTG
jgi:hypothetical protein